MLHSFSTYVFLMHVEVFLCFVLVKCIQKTEAGGFSLKKYRLRYLVPSCTYISLQRFCLLGLFFIYKATGLQREFSHDSLHKSQFYEGTQVQVK